jgi:hypothetical protein
MLQSFRLEDERASYNGSIEASQASDTGSIPVARSIKSIDAVGFTGFLPRNSPPRSEHLNARPTNMRDVGSLSSALQSRLTSQQQVI